LLGRTVRELLASVDAHELAEWEVLEYLDPWGRMAQDIQHAADRALAANLAPGKAAGKVYQAKDFMPAEPEPPRQQTPEEMMSIFQGIAAKQNPHGHD
jgi:hypothetical protein